MSLIHDPETYENFEKVILIHGVRWTSELAYHDYLENELPKHEFLAGRLALDFCNTLSRADSELWGPAPRDRIEEILALIEGYWAELDKRLTGASPS